MRSLSDLYARAQDSPELIPPAAPQPPSTTKSGERSISLRSNGRRCERRQAPPDRGFLLGRLERRHIWLTRNLPLDEIRKQAEAMEHEATQFYEKAAERATDVGVRRLLDDLAIVEKGTAN